MPEFNIMDEKPTGKSTRFYIIIAVVVGIAAFVIGILIGRFATCPDEKTEARFSKYTQEADPEISKLIIDAISNVNIENNLR